MKFSRIAQHPLNILFSVVLLLSCTADRKPEADEKFEALAGNFIEQYLNLFPEHATELGDHRFDGRLNDRSDEGRERARAMFEVYLDSLKSMDVAVLSPSNRIDYDILQHTLSSRLFSMEEVAEWRWNPLHYNTGGAVYSLLARDFAPLSERMQHVQSRLEAIPAVLEEAKKHLGHPPLIHTETAIRQNQGTIALIEETLQSFADELPARQQTELNEIRTRVVEALKAYGQWLQHDLLPRSDGNFRLGENLFKRKLTYALNTSMQAERILEMAEQELGRTTRELFETALPMYRELFPDAAFDEKDPVDRNMVIRTVLDGLARQRPNDETILEQAKADLRDAERFVREHGLVTIPTEPLEIIVMPEFQRGVAVAYCDSPGPLEENGKTFYAIAPTPDDWPDTRRKSFYREYNNAMLKNLTVHEAMPSHYLQLVTGNKAQTSTLIRALFQSGVFAEGWATYTEQLMADAGFGGAAVKMQQLKMKLRLLINAIIDQNIHAGTMTEKQAMDLMMNTGFQEEGEAAGKWRRACLTSAQLTTYFYGNLKINELRRRYEAVAGEQFDMMEFHDELLSFGTISPKYLPMLLHLPAEL